LRRAYLLHGEIYAESASPFPSTPTPPPMSRSTDVQSTSGPHCASGSAPGNLPIADDASLSWPGRVGANRISLLVPGTGPPHADDPTSHTPCYRGGAAYCARRPRCIDGASQSRAEPVRAPGSPVNEGTPRI
jgi:hypothetical protein